jgi:malate dehydrogenase (oxaloacetate-decarboxylating)
LAGLINAAKVVKKKLVDMRVVIVGAGAAGRAVALLLTQAGVGEVMVTDRQGIIYEGRSGLTSYKKELAKMTNPERREGDVLAAVKGADVLVGVSGPGTIAKHHIEEMNDDAIVFALANPIPEIKPEDAKRAGAAVVATGRSDYPNQVNNSLVFPGLFRGALDKQVRTITDETKLAAAKKLAAMVRQPTCDNIIPGVMEPGLVQTIASAVKKG